MMTALLRLPALVAVLGTAPGQAADTVHYRLYKFERATGDERDVVVRAPAGDTTHARFSFTDRGTPVTLEATLVSAGDGTPLAFSARGRTSRSSGADVAVTVGGATALVRTGTDSSRAALTAPWFSSIGYAPVIAQEALIRYWLSRGRPARIALVPAGGVTITDRGLDTMAVGGRTAVLRRIGVRDLVWGRETVWLDSTQHLTALVTRDAEFDHFEAVADGYEPAVPDFVRRAAADEMAELAELNRGAGVAGDFALVGGMLVDGTGRPAVPDATVIVRGGRITAVGPRSRVAVPRGMTIVSARGRTILPGLWDMHAHVEQVDWGPVYLAAGITTARDVGNEQDFIVAMRDALRSGRGIGPRLLMAGVIDGGGNRAIGLDTAVTPEQGARLVDAYAAAGFNQIKVYSSLTPPVLTAIVTEAHRQHLTVTGHIPAGMTIYDGVNAGMDQVNHVTYVYDAARDSAFQRTAEHPFAPLDSTRLARVVAFLAAHHTVVDPTVALYEQFLRPVNVAPASVEPGIAKLAPALRAQFAGGGVPAAMATAARQRLDALLTIVGALRRAGVTIVAGTDQAVPGYSLHRELELYVAAGMSPMEAIQSATSVPARVMGLIQDTGTIEPGKRADLIVVDGNPLARISDTRNVRLVVANGRRYDPAPLWRSVGFEP